MTSETEIPEFMKTEQALTLIAYDKQNGKKQMFNLQGFRVTEEAAYFLKNLKERVGIVAVAGKYRTGKSFLLNRVILNKVDTGFGVGPTINPCTKGLWIWNRPIELEHKGETFKVLVVDSEGIGAFNEDQNHDTRIFLLALLLSSYFVFNSMGTIDENALENLSLIVNLSKQLQVQSTVGSTDPEEIAKYFPSFLWVVRDFTLRLHDQYGNTITSKEYLEKALENQKGTSDQIENKNRVRRMIKHFFQDRDCFTMVRPTEEEKDLQKLQKMDDHGLRPEFVDQMNVLRNKIYKRTRPKVLNNKILTGEMLLELCHSYTESINKGSVPCIESAWTYICNNECQRSMDAAIKVYEQHMENLIKPPKKGEESSVFSYDDLKQAHKDMKAKCLAEFKDKALGDKQQGFEEQIMKGIAEKFAQIKLKSESLFKKQVEDFLAPHLKTLEQQIKQNQFPKMIDFTQELDKIKQNFVKNGPKIANKESQFTELTERLVMKAADYIAYQAEQEVTIKIRTLEEKNLLLENDLNRVRSDGDIERQKLQLSKDALENENQMLKQNLHVAQEKIKRLEKERNEVDDEAREKLQKITRESDETIAQLREQLREFSQQHSARDNDSFTKISELEKQLALQQQKIEFYEQEVKKHKSKTEREDQQNTSRQQELAILQTKLSDTQERLSKMEYDRREEIRKMQEEYERKILQLNLQLGEGGKEENQGLKKEVESLTQQLSFARLQIDENKKIHETLMTALSSNQQRQNDELYSHQNRNSSILETNKNLSQTIARVEQRNQALEQKLTDLKQYQRVFKHANSVQCKNCDKFMPIECFTQHINSCNSQGKYAQTYKRTSQPLTILISQTLIREDESHKPYTEYVISLSMAGRSWSVNRKYKDFCLLNETLMNHFPSIKFPESASQFGSKSLNELFSGRRGPVLEDRRKALQQYIQDLSLIPVIKESQFFQEFVEITHGIQRLLNESQNEIQHFFNTKGIIRSGTQSASNLGSVAPDVKKPMLQQMLTRNQKFETINHDSIESMKGNDQDFKSNEGKKSMLKSLLQKQDDSATQHPSSIQELEQFKESQSDELCLTSQYSSQDDRQNPHAQQQQLNHQHQHQHQHNQHHHHHNHHNAGPEKQDTQEEIKSLYGGCSEGVDNMNEEPSEILSALSTSAFQMLNNYNKQPTEEEIQNQINQHIRDSLTMKTNDYNQYNHAAQEIDEQDQILIEMGASQPIDDHENGQLSPYKTSRDDQQFVSAQQNFQESYFPYDDAVNDLQEVVQNRSPSAMSQSSYQTADQSRYIDDDTYTQQISSQVLQQYYDYEKATVNQTAPVIPSQNDLQMLQQVTNIIESRGHNSLENSNTPQNHSSVKVQLPQHYHSQANMVVNQGQLALKQQIKGSGGQRTTTQPHIPSIVDQENSQSPSKRYHHQGGAPNGYSNLMASKQGGGGPPPQHQQQHQQQQNQHQQQHSRGMGSQQVSVSAKLSPKDKKRQVHHQMMDNRNLKAYLNAQQQRR